MKRFCLILLILSLLISASACQSDNDSSVTDESGNVISGNDAALSEEDKIINTVLNLMESFETQKDPTDLFAHFAGDFQITNFSSKNGVKSIKRREAVIFADTVDSDYYGIEAAGYLCYASNYNQRAEVIADFALAADAPKASTIFTAFGIDTSALYTASKDNSKPIALTADMLTVSEDKATCTFDKTYIDAFAEEVCKTLELMGSKKTSFMSKYTGSGIYSVKDNKVTFDIKLKDNQLGSIHQIVKYAIDTEGKVYAYSYFEYSNSSLGINIPIIAEIECKDVVYRDNEPISATIKLKESSTNKFKDGGVDVKIATTAETTFKLDCTDLDSRSATVSRKTKNVESALGESSTYNYTHSLSIDLGKSTSQFQLTKKDDYSTTYSLTANKVTFAKSPAIVTPANVTNEIANYVANKIS